MKNREICSGSFPPSGFETCDKIVFLAEFSSTLGLLFQYIYPHPNQTCSHCYLNFEVMTAVAEAAENYQVVYPAMYVCNLIMRCGTSFAGCTFAHRREHRAHILPSVREAHVLGEENDQLDVKAILSIPVQRPSWGKNTQQKRPPRCRRNKPVHLKP